MLVTISDKDCIYMISGTALAATRMSDVVTTFPIVDAGSEVVIAHNVLDVSSALDVTLFSHMTIRSVVGTLKS